MLLGRDNRCPMLFVVFWHHVLCGKFFDGIIVTAAAPIIPPQLLAQLAVGGRMVLPVGGDEVQQLKVVDHTPDGLVETVHEYVRFVPLMSGVTPK